MVHLLGLANFFLFTLAAVRGVRACLTDDDCSLNGVCDAKTSTCTCDPGWVSSDCGKLDLLPAAKGTGYNYTNATMPDHFSTRGGNSSWGGQIIQDRNDKSLFHLVISQLSRGCGLAGWRPFSTVIRAESRNGPAGPYEWKQELFGTFHHNPTTIWSPADEKYLIYFIGRDMETPDTCRSIKMPNNVSVASSPDLKVWDEQTLLLINKTNPTPWPLWTPENPTSEMILGVEDNVIHKADSYIGPYSLIKKQPWNTSDYSDHWSEDPFLWRDKRGNWHILVHWMVDIAERGEKFPRVGGHLFSRELTGNWTWKLQEVYNTTVHFTDGSRTDYLRRERPKLFFSDDGEMTPLYLVNGVQQFNSSGSYTLIQPIGKSAKKYERDLGFHADE
ncbi:hypothetical protein BS50DRAFT_605708 [Corynespora cassiicola Philippines]|uniref:EGF-like domain-containing protein n=1 Tax=Corynespora cassiicola Philippines TaxID=1448308 RepID=A0A2T2P8R2_CORCC|nr:hypothetical protein BS50DRAFT_605708 [Corynespora cassiicola Philippines]